MLLSGLLFGLGIIAALILFIKPELISLILLAFVLVVIAGILRILFTPIPLQELIEKLSEIFLVAIYSIFVEKQFDKIERARLSDKLKFFLLYFLIILFIFLIGLLVFLCVRLIFFPF